MTSNVIWPAKDFRTNWTRKFAFINLYGFQFCKHHLQSQQQKLFYLQMLYHAFKIQSKIQGIIKIRNFFLGLMLFQMPGQFVLFMSSIITNLTLEWFITNVDFDMPSTISRTTKDLWTERTSKLLHANFQGISLQDNLKKENYQIDVK